MRFFVTGEQNRKLLINSLILMFLGYIALLWLSNGLMYFHKMDLTADSVIAYYLGSEQDFTQPRSYQSLLEVSHFHLFSMAMLVLTLTHLMIMTDIVLWLKISLSGAVYLFAVGDELSGWLVRFVHPGFAYVKIAMFVGLELSLLALLIIVTASLIGARSQTR
ncbi:MAG: hypothetical protein RQ715_10365 [Methylococcales bacterium]|nr:hypothetical protein [Methylococcales bacterium]